LVRQAACLFPSFSVKVLSQPWGYSTITFLILQLIAAIIAKLVSPLDKRVGVRQT
jgi:hypothetical protein